MLNELVLRIFDQYLNSNTEPDNILLVCEFEPEPTKSVPLETHALFLFGSVPPLILTLAERSTAIFPYFEVLSVSSYV